MPKIKLAALRLALATLSICAATPAIAELERTTYGDWSIRCRANNYCIAETEGRASNGEAFRLKLERGAKPEAEVFVTLRPTTPLSPGLLARIEVEGQEENYGYFGRVTKVYKGNEMTFGGEADRPLIEALRLGQNARIQIEYAAPNQTRTYTVTLKGLTHALLRIDEEQGRIGKQDAIVAWGGADPEEDLDMTVTSPKAPPPRQTASELSLQASTPTAPAPSPAPAPSQGNDLPPPVMPSQEIASGPGSALVYELDDIPENLQRLGFQGLNCDLEQTVPAFGAQMYAEGDVETWIIPCQMADVNVPSFLATHIPFNPSLDEWKEFETPPGFNQPNHALVNNLFFDPQTREVTGTTYYGPGYDCGTFERHEEMAESGEYELVLYLEKSQCDGISGPPEGWPLSWTIDEMGG